MGQWFAAEERNAFDLLIALGTFDFGQQIGELPVFPAFEGDELGIAAARAAQRTALKPNREALAGAFGFGAGDELSQGERPKFKVQSSKFQVETRFEFIAPL
jgi:hypothetical protein